MPKEKTIQSEIGGYISALLRNHFGKGPTSVFVTIKNPYIIIHLRGFIAPMETVLLKKQEWKRVLETRDLLINELKGEIEENLRRIANLNIREFYADWNLDSETGILIGIMPDDVQQEDFEWPAHIDKDVLESKVANASEKAERNPGSIESFWLNDRTLLVKRNKILVGIENALIAEGYSEILKLAKRPLERSLLYDTQPEKTLGRPVTEIFLDWNFNDDIGYIVFMMEPVKKMRD
ncbi:MAG TPA: Na-translocating system protein MpsC family protein [Planococcus sp. (in: firmicutes)]|nr:Na-translocating system protein MpsC family protein [Planococcus sp. (in: firmicutes)]